MESTALPAGFAAATFEAFVDSRNEPGWIVDLRRQAFALYEQKLTEPLDPEEWKRIDLRTLRPGNFALQPSGATATFDTLLESRATFAGNLTHIDGTAGTASIDARLINEGVLFGDLSIMLQEHREIFEPIFMQKAVQAGRDRFSAWHAAFWTGGTVLYVPRNVTIDEPLHSLIGLSAANAVDLSHTLIVLEEGASATLLEETCSANPDQPGLHVGAVELLVGKGAHLRYAQLQNWNEQTYHFAHQSGRVDTDATLQWTVAGIGSRLAHIHQDVFLDGKGASAEVNGVTFATGRQLLSYYTEQTHNAENTRSDLLYKDVLRDKARVVWRGMIRVEKEAQKTDGYQRNDSLLLSPTCRADAIPGLEIEADDVRCTHGATAGRVDEEQIFYCMCRGMSEYEAMHMIVEGFFHGVYDRIAIDTRDRIDLEDEDDDETPKKVGGLIAVRETLSHAVEKKLGIGE